MFQAGEQSLEERVFGLHRALGSLLAHAGTLPLIQGEAPPVGRSPLSDWPGMGSFERYWRETAEGPIPMELSATLDAIFQQLWAGLERYEAGDVAGAAAVWGAGFETLWGAAALEALGVLQRALIGYRAEHRPRRRSSRRAPLVMLHDRSAPPRREEPVERATLGLRIRPVSDGVEIIAVHPRGPAAGQFRPGDRIIAVDATSLEGMDEESAGRALTGVPGSSRTYTFRRDGTLLTVTLRAVPLSALS